MTSVNAELFHREYDPPKCADEWHRENHFTATDCPKCGEHWEPGPKWESEPCNKPAKFEVVSTAMFANPFHDATMQPNGTLPADSGIVVGSRWRDNDPRKNRIVEVVRVGRGSAFIKPVQMDGNPGYARITETKLSRFGKRGRAGFTLLPSANGDSNA